MLFWRAKQGHAVDLLITKSSRPVLGIETKYKKRLEKSDYLSIKKIQEEHPNLPIWIVANVTNPYEEAGVLILPWKYFLEKKLGEI